MSERDKRTITHYKVQTELGGYVSMATEKNDCLTHQLISFIFTIDRCDNTYLLLITVI